jgi:hypothetical protein
LRASSHLLSGDLGNDGLGSKTVLGNFHDDGAMLVATTLRLPLFYQEFDRIGIPHGLCTNWDKSGTLVTLDPSDAPTNQDYLDGISLLASTQQNIHPWNYIPWHPFRPPIFHSFSSYGSSR